jgi:hypothetical protein
MPVDAMATLGRATGFAKIFSSVYSTQIWTWRALYGPCTWRVYRSRIKKKTQKNEKTGMKLITRLTNPREDDNLYNMDQNNLLVIGKRSKIW